MENGPENCLKGYSQTSRKTFAFPVLARRHRFSNILKVAMQRKEHTDLA